MERERTYDPDEECYRRNQNGQDRHARTGGRCIRSWRRAIGAIALGAMAIGRTNRLSLKYQRPADERAKPFCLVRPEFRRLDSMKTPTLFAGMGSANKYPWTDPQPADANSLR